MEADLAIPMDQIWLEKNICGVVWSDIQISIVFLAQKVYIPVVAVMEQGKMIAGHVVETVV